ncbi:norbelladine synthase-like [Aristolochia californica]|uniref:norbelladine synthase-like n=1 Tax=Aristolochia californica TaxID=171875 RepID=UPI0035DAB955
MHGQVSHEQEVGQPASKVWEIYGTLQLAKLVVQKLPNLIEKLEIDGDGGVGTVLTLGLPNATPRYAKYKEKFLVVDNEKRVKVADVIEGGYLDLGFTSYRATLEIVEKEGGSSIIRSTVDYEIDDQNASKSSLVTTAALELIAKMVAEHLTESNGEMGSAELR